MRYAALATDYDGTLAHDGVVSEATIDCLEKLRQSGRKAILVTGRELPDLERVFPRLDLFDRVVAENGALMYNPASKEQRALAEPPPAKFVESLRRRVPNLSAGAVIVALWRPHEQEALETIREFGLELQIIFNKDAVMILPSGINKMTGLTAALQDLKISRRSVVGIGDAENDHAFLDCCECSVAVANAIPSLKEEADFVTTTPRGEGVCEVVRKMLENDLIDLAPRLQRHDLALGKAASNDVSLAAYGSAVLVCGQSGGGKSTLILGLVERLTRKGYQVCLIDPEGDYDETEQFVTTGDSKHAPSLDHLEKSLTNPDAQLTINLVGVPVENRPEFVSGVLALFDQHRSRYGRPHWIIVDEAHHMFPRESGSEGIRQDSGSFVLVTVHPRHVSPPALKQIRVVIVVGKEPGVVLGEYCATTGRSVPPIPDGDLPTGQALVWFVDSDQPVARVKTEPPRAALERHKRKYAGGQLEEERVFYFRGPENKLNLRAQNLNLFVQIAEGVDEATWFYHARRGEFSKWLREGIRDDDLASQVQAIEQDESLSAAESRGRVARAIQEKYTAPE